MGKRKNHRVLLTEYYASTVPASFAIFFNTIIAKPLAHYLGRHRLGLSDGRECTLCFAFIDLFYSRFARSHNS